MVAVVTTSATIAFTAASGAHLKALVPSGRLMEANSRFESAFWFSNSLGTPLGGALITLLGATTTLVADAFSYLLSALGVSRIAKPEPAPTVRAEGSHWRGDLLPWRPTLSH